MPDSIHIFVFRPLHFRLLQLVLYSITSPPPPFFQIFIHLNNLRELKVVCSCIELYMGGRGGGRLHTFSEHPCLSFSNFEIIDYDYDYWKMSSPFHTHPLQFHTCQYIIYQKFRTEKLGKIEIRFVFMLYINLFKNTVFG